LPWLRLVLIETAQGFIYPSYQVLSIINRLSPN
jgi:hypothetical protein